MTTRLKRPIAFCWLVLFWPCKVSATVFAAFLMLLVAPLVVIADLKISALLILCHFCAVFFALHKVAGEDERFINARFCFA